MDVSRVTSVGIGQVQMVGGVGGKLGVCRCRKGVDFVRVGRPWVGQSDELGWVGQVGFAVTLGWDNTKERCSDVIALDSDVNARQRVAAQIAARREGLRLDWTRLGGARLPGVADQRDRGGPGYGYGVGLGGTVLCSHRYGEGGVSDDEVEVCLILRVGVVVVRDGHGGVAFVLGRCQ